MSDDEITRLEREIAERTQRLQELRKPMSRDEARELAAADPDAFNAKVDAGLVPAAALGGKGG